MLCRRMLAALLVTIAAGQAIRPVFAQENGTLVQSGATTAGTSAPFLIPGSPVNGDWEAHPFTSWDMPEETRGFLQSDHAFSRFIGPVSAPILSKDPRSLTEVRGLFIENWMPDTNPTGNGNFQVYAAQLRVALTDRLTFIADKDGYASLHPGHIIPSASGWLDIAAGLKYTFIRDVENQFLLTGGFMFEPPTGEKKVFQHSGAGLLTVFGTSGKEINENWHILGNLALQVPMNSNANSTFGFAQVHLDRACFGWFYPLVEFNWYHYLAGGNHGLPAILGELDNLINLGTSQMANADLVTMAAGAKARLSRNLELGSVYEYPLSNRQDFLGGRLIAELILRY